jgi:hypothetical protein
MKLFRGGLQYHGAISGWFVNLPRLLVTSPILGRRGTVPRVCQAPRKKVINLARQKIYEKILKI